MGCAPSSSSSSSSATDRAISRSLRRAAEANARTPQLLLLGTGYAGKSTFFKQMRILHVPSAADGDRDVGGEAKEAGFSDAERREAVPHIRAFLVGALRTLVGLTADFGLLQEVTRLDFLVTGGGVSGAMNAGAAIPTLPQICRAIFEHEAVQQLWKAAPRRPDVQQIPESLDYFVQRVDVVAGAEYLPTVEDILNVRVQTFGVRDARYALAGGNSFRIIDVGGQRSERRKWLPLFEGVSAILFITAVSEYDQVCSEDLCTNRVVESLNVFGTIANHPALQTADLVLLLNKRDLLADKIGRVPIHSISPFADCAAGEDYEEVMAYFTHKFSAAVQHPGRAERMIVHPMCATDTEQVEMVFDLVKSKVLRARLSAFGV